MTEQVTTRVWYEAHATATSDRPGEEPTDIVVKAGVWYGMGGWSQPSWSEHGATQYITLAEAATEHRHFPNAMHGFKNVRDVRYIEVTQTIRTTTHAITVTPSTSE